MYSNFVQSRWCASRDRQAKSVGQESLAVPPGPTDISIPILGSNGSGRAILT